MQAAILPTYPCFTCQKKLGEPNEMQLVAPGVYWCPVCKNTKDRIIAIHPIALLSLSSLTVAIPLLKATLPILQSMSLEAQVGMGAFLFAGYLLAGVRKIGGP